MCLRHAGLCSINLQMACLACLCECTAFGCWFVGSVVYGSAVGWATQLAPATVAIGCMLLIGGWAVCNAGGGLSFKQSLQPSLRKAGTAAAQCVWSVRRRAGSRVCAPCAYWYDHAKCAHVMHGCWVDKLQLVWREWVACVASEDPTTADVGLLQAITRRQ
jgi:hypothetical protein